MSKIFLTYDSHVAYLFSRAPSCSKTVIFVAFRRLHSVCRSHKLYVCQCAYSTLGEEVYVHTFKEAPTTCIHDMFAYSKTGDTIVFTEVHAVGLYLIGDCHVSKLANEMLLYSLSVSLHPPPPPRYKDIGLHHNIR